MSFNDQQIILAIREGDNNPDPYLEHLYAQNRAPVIGYVLNNNGTRDEALELLHVGIIKVYEMVQDGNYTGTGTLNRYLISICRNTWINQKKRGRRMIRLAEGEGEDQPDDSSPLDYLENEDKRTMTRQLLNKIGEKCRQLLMWAEAEDRSMKWIATQMGYSGPQVARNEKSGCKKKLVKIVKGNENFSRLVNEIILN